MRRLHTFTSQRGQSLVELLLAFGLFAVLVPALLLGVFVSREGKPQQVQRVEATALLSELIEAVRVIRESDWSSVATAGTYHPVSNGTTWSLSAGSETRDSFTRELVLEDVMRSPQGQIVETGGVLDPSTKKITARVSWSEPAPAELVAEQYITRYLDNLTYTETTVADFEAGQTGTLAVVDLGGGAVQLGAGGQGDWCKPSEFIRAELDLPQESAARDVKAYEGKAFTGTRQSGGGSFVEIGLSNDNPPVASIESSMTGYETNDVFIEGNYAYVATNDYTRDVVIIDLTTQQEVGYFNDSAWFGTAQGVWVVGDVGYVTIGFRLHTFDLSSKTGNRPELDSISLGFFATGYRLQVVGGYAYVAIDWGSYELRLVDVTNPADLRLGARGNVNGERGQELFVNETGTRVYLATDRSGSYNELFIINADVPASSKRNSSFNLPIISEYDSGGMDPTGVTVVPGNKVILVGTEGEEYQVIDITNEQTLVRCGGAEVDSGIYGVAAVLESDDDAYSYIVTGDSSNEFKIIEGGPGGSFASEGVFESATFTTTHSTAFNRLTASVSQPVTTDVRMQIAVAPAVLGSCAAASYTFVGPGGDPGTFFTPVNGEILGTVPFSSLAAEYQNPGQCVRYRAYLSTTDVTFTPLVYDVTINYSP